MSISTRELKSLLASAKPGDRFSITLRGQISWEDFAYRSAVGRFNGYVNRGEVELRLSDDLATLHRICQGEEWDDRHAGIDCEIVGPSFNAEAFIDNVAAAIESIRPIAR